MYDIMHSSLLYMVYCTAVCYVRYTAQTFVMYGILHSSFFRMLYRTALCYIRYNAELFVMYDILHSYFLCTVIAHVFVM